MEWRWWTPVVCSALGAACSADGGQVSAGSAAAGGESFVGGGGGTAGQGAAIGVGGTAATGGAPGQGGTGGASPESQTDACVRYVEAACQRLTECGWVTFESCMQQTGTKCPDYYFAQGSARTVDELLACAEIIRSFACETELIPSCVLPGTLPQGSPCVVNSQCESLACASSGEGCGECEGLYAPGENCRLYSGLKDCGPNMTCGSEGTCVPLESTGAPRPPNGGHLCRCDDATCTVTPCRVEGLVGEACDATRPCHAAAACEAGRCVAKAGVAVSPCR